MKYTSIILISLLIATGCKEPGNKYLTITQEQGIETTSIDFTKIQATRDSLTHDELWPLSRLTDDIQVIRLETGDNCLVSGKAIYGIEDSCIVVIQNDQIMTFDREGHFQHTVAVFGRAPEEFGKFQDARVKDGKVYLLDEFGKGKIFSVKKGEGYSTFQGSTKDFWYNSFLPLEHGQILMVPFKCESTKNLFYIQDADGKYLQGMPCPPNQDILQYNGRKLVSQVGQEYRYASFTCDTVFQIVQEDLVPKWIFKVGGQQEVEVEGETSRFLFVRVKTVTNRNVKDGVTYTSFSTESYCYDKENKKLSTFGNIWDDHFASIYRGVQELHIQNGEWFYWVYPASMLAESIPDILLSEKVDDKIKERLKDWEGKISLDDNPVLLVGRLK